MRSPEPSKWRVALILVGSAILLAAMHLVASLVFHGRAPDDGLSWPGVARYMAIVLGIYAYGLFVVMAKVEGRFGRFRKPINGTILAAVVLGVAWIRAGAFDASLLGFAAIAFMVGWFAETWIQGL